MVGYITDILGNKFSFTKCVGFLLLFVCISSFAPSAFAKPSQETFDTCDAMAEELKPFQENYIYETVVNKIRGKLVKIGCYIYAFIADEFAPILSLMLVIYISIFGIMIMLGLSQISAADAIMNLLKIILIWLFATNVNVGFKGMWQLFNGISDAGIELSMKVYSDSKEFNCLGEPKGGDYKSFSNMECFFRHMFGMDSVNEDTQQYAKKHAECEAKYEQYCSIGGTNCYLNLGSSKEGWTTKCNSTLKKNVPKGICTDWEVSILGGCYQKTTPLASLKIGCEKMWSTCQSSANRNNGACAIGGPTDTRSNILYDCAKDAVAEEGQTNKVISFIYVAFAMLVSVYIFGPILFLFCIKLLILVTYLFLRAIAGLFLVWITLALLISTSAIFLTFALFESTKNYFDKWMRELGRQAIQPFILLAGLAFFNNVLWGQVKFFTDIVDHVYTFEYHFDNSDNFSFSNIMPHINFDEIPKISADGTVEYPYTEANLPAVDRNRCKLDVNGIDPIKLRDRCAKLCHESLSLTQRFLVVDLYKCEVACKKGGETFIDDCAENLFKRDQAGEFARDAFANLIGMIILVFAAIAYVENIGTIVRITATKLSRLGPNMAPIPADTAASGSIYRGRQYASTFIERIGPAMQARSMAQVGRGYGLQSRARKMATSPFKTSRNIGGGARNIGSNIRTVLKTPIKAPNWKNWKNKEHWVEKGKKINDNKWVSLKPIDARLFKEDGKGIINIAHEQGFGAAFGELQESIQRNRSKETSRTLNMFERVLDATSTTAANMLDGNPNDFSKHYNDLLGTGKGAKTTNRGDIAHEDWQQGTNDDD